MFAIMLILFTGILCLPEYSTLTTLPSEFYHLIFGNVLSMEDLYLPEEDDLEIKSEFVNVEDISNKTFAEILDNDAYTLHDPDEVLESFKEPIVSSDGPDKNLFDELNFNVYNFTRKFNTWRPSKNYSVYESEIQTVPRDEQILFEYTKIRKVNQLCIQLLIHSRYRIASAMKQRDRIRIDKRYQIGYLFCRIRRLRIDMLKLIGAAYEQFQDEMPQKVLVLMRLYEEVVRLNQDIRDTLNYIKAVNARDSAEHMVPDDTTISP